ncbi:MAG: hypothetical protein GY797_33375 [Deltaproteobacteria bacterium]|nr:hypothetical protein [Deltaproteobacteria bacterium]
MPKVPKFESNVGIAVPTVKTGQVLARPKESFGIQQSQAQANLGKAIAGAADTITQIAIKKQQENEEKEALKKELDFKGVINNALYSSDVEVIEQNGKTVRRPKGLLNRRLGQTRDSALEFDEQFRKLYDEATADISDYQKSRLHPALLSNYESSRNAVIQHQAREESRDYEQTYNATLDQIISDSAAFENPDDVNGSIDRASLLVDQGMRRMGATDETVIVRKAQDVISRIADNNITALLEKDPNKANVVFEKIKDKLPADTREVLAAKIADKQFTMQRTAVWEALNDEHRQADGTYDMESFRREIDELPNYNSKQKDQLFNYAEGRARDAEQALKKNQASNYKSFMNEAITAKDKNAPYDQVLNLAAKYATEPVERQKMENDIRKMYDNVKTDPSVYTMLYQELKTGELTETRLDDFKDKISGNDFKTFSKGIADQIINPKNNIAYKETNATIKVMLDKKFGANKQKKDDFLVALYDQHEREGGGSPDKLLQNATDLFDKVQVNPWPIIGKKPKYEVRSSKIKEDREFKAQLENDVGRDVVQEIGRGAMVLKGTKTFSANDIREFVDKFGGYDKIQPGTEPYRAIKYLMDNKKRVTPSTVQSVMDYLKKQQ